MHILYNELSLQIITAIFRLRGWTDNWGRKRDYGSEIKPTLWL